MEEDIKSESTLDDDWVRESGCSPLETAQSAETRISEGVSDIENEVESFTLSDSEVFRLKPSLVERYSRSWPRFLGTQNKPGMPKEFVYEGEDAEIIRFECTKLATRLGLDDSVAKDVEKVVGLFCEREECPFEYPWMDVIEMLIPFHSSLDFMYNAFYAIITKYLPRRTTKGALCYHLMHLILQYHDPVLSTHLASQKLDCYDLAHPCFDALFVSAIPRSTLYAIWDRYFEKGDPFLIFTMLLVFLVNCSEQLVKMNDNSKMVDVVLSSMRLVSEDDVDDLLEVSAHFLSTTPPSIQQDFQRVLFGSRLESLRKVDVASLLALPVDPRDLIRLTTDENSNALEPRFSFFIIDARSHDDFAAGHLEGSYNLDASLFVEAPEQYRMALSSLDAYRNASRRNHHLLFMGAGREESDLYLNMVVANFLQQGRKHVALVQGGYKVLHELLSSNLERLQAHSASMCNECAANCSATQSKTPTYRRRSWMLGVSNLLGAVKATAPSMAEKMLNLTTSSKSPEAHVASAERHGKRYRNERSVFTLSDSDSECEDPTSSTRRMSALNAQPRKLSEILAQDDILEHFEGVEVVSDGSHHSTVNCYLALTRTHIHVLQRTEKDDEVITQARHAYGSVLRVSSKKKLPEMITFKFGYATDDGDYRETCVQRFVLPKAGECVKAIKMNIVALQPGLLA